MKLTKIFLLAFFVLIGSQSAFCQDSKDVKHKRSYSKPGNRHKSATPKLVDNSDLVGIKAPAAYLKLQSRGFGEVKEVRDGANTYKLFFNAKSSQCIKTTSRDGKISSVKAATNCQ
ncbi:MAG: hypothetical protein EOO50_08965 [Flavobacterium sp.]|uniref:hypothetical protein n=1 Tax=Flavobacterium sp. TaxID=239 RepID=UPI0012002563|nr:hypothetical protein [Flavobacterium sp.]RZJ66646.1 MAG: hypothetical protein EOO50_08965 [Flavobacterium sp.]